MARSRKEQPKPSLEQRMRERWDQQVFFINKQFPRSTDNVREIQQRYKADQEDDFMPTEEAVRDLEALYVNLRNNQQAG